MSSPLLTCPLCSQPGFQTLDSLRYGLISAATRQVVCPLCHDILFGLDKFTIHLFSHSVQHQHEGNNSSFPMHIPSFSSAAAPLKQQDSLPSQANSLMLCTKADLSSKVKNMKELSVPCDHTNIYPGKSQQTAPVSSGYCTNEMKIEDKVRMVNMDDKQSCKIVSGTSEATKKPQPKKTEKNAMWEEQLSSNKLDCTYAIASQSSNIALHSCAQSNCESVTVDNAKKSSQIVSECLEAPQTAVMRSISSSLGNKPMYHPYHCSAGNISKTTHQNTSVQCPAVPSIPPPSQEKLKPVSPTEKEIKEIIRCDICGFAFDDASILAIHHQLVHCMGSGSETPSHRIQALDGSKQSWISDEKHQFPCHLCSKAFKMRGSLMVHLRVAHSSGIVSGKSFISRVDPGSHSEERKFSCHLCSKSFRKEQHLLQHLKTHEGKQWECDVCSKLFTTKYFLKKHKRLHTGETPYSCDTCGKTFTFQQSYHKHLLYHSDEKPHVCAECDRAFKELSTLHNHQRIHTGEKPFACETCGKCFRQRVSYLVHRRIHTGAMPYQCTACGKSFRYKVSQRTHKCPSQPPGTVVRQSSDLMLKLLQGVQQKSVLSSSQMIPTHASVNNSEKGKTVETQQPPPPAQRLADESHHFQVSQQNQQTDNSQFTIIVGNDVQPVFPTGNILLASSSLYSAPSVSAHAVCSSSSDSSEKKQRTDTQKMKEEIGFLSRGIQTPPKSAAVSITMATADFKDKQENHEGQYVLQDNNNNMDVSKNSVDCDPKMISLNAEGSQEELTHANNNNKNSILTTEAKSAQNSVFVQESDFPVSAKNKVSTCRSSDFWKPSNKISESVDISDLVVQTTDFFNMVMSPSVKSLPSPSERLKHLTLSSPVDTLLNYEDDGMYQFLLNSDDTAVHTNTEEITDTSSAETSKSSSSKTTQKEESGTKPLQTINEESLKQLLYGTTSS